MSGIRSLPIEECGEPMVAIPRGRFILIEPHAYMKLGAPYGDASPWMLRKRVLDALTRAQDRLRKDRPDWTIMIYDAYRPNRVQAYMVEREYKIQAKAAGIDLGTLSPEERYTKLGEKVFRLWGVPNEDPASPPPHSTGGAVDITIADGKGKEIEMGSPVDENSDRSYPDHFAKATDATGKRAHENRELLNGIMQAEKFHRYDKEWWHFCLGDQMWSHYEKLANPGSRPVAYYGRADVLKQGAACA